MIKNLGTLRRSALTMLCSAAMVCSGLAPMAVQAEEGPYVILYSTPADGSEEKAVRLDSENTSSTEFGGTITFEDGKLTLDGVTLYSAVNNKDVIDARGGVTIELKGTNYITNNFNNAWYNDGVRSFGDLTITGPGSLVIKSWDRGINVEGNGSLVIDGANISVYSYESMADGIYADKTLTVENGANIKVDTDQNYYAAHGIRAHGVTIRDSKISATGNCTGINNESGSEPITIENSTVAAKSTRTAGNAYDAGLKSNAADNGIVITGDSDVKVYGNVYGAAPISATAPEDNGIRVEVAKNTDGSGAEQVEKDAVDVYPYPTAEEAKVFALTDTFENVSADLQAIEVAKFGYLHIWNDALTGVTPAKKTTAAAQKAKHEHVYEWETDKYATATSDGVMKYRCKYCGAVEYEVPISAYYVFNKDTQEAILKASQGATVKVQTPLFISFHEMVKNALQERSDVTLVVDYKNGKGLYEMTIPAGSGDQLATLFGESKFAGFLYLGGAYATTELPADTQFTNVPAELMWFGTTNAH